MTTIDRDRDVIQMAANLGLDWKMAPTAAIIRFCKERIAAWIADAPDVRTLDALEALVCRKLRLVIEEFSSEKELDAIVARYIQKGEFVFATQRDGFGPETFATLIRRDNATATCPDQFVALIDCRGEKATRRFFTRWHEIAHVLTLVRGQMALPFHRSTTNRDPIEQLMDKIAAEVGFFDDIFRPGVRSAVADAGGLSLELVEQIRSAHCSRASFLATLIAVVTRAHVPAVSIEAGWAYKKSEERLLRAPELFPDIKPKAVLRVLSVGCNEAALQDGLRIHRNMRVPETSVIARVIQDPIVWGSRVSLKGVESLETWTTSSDGPIGLGGVTVEARRHGEQVIALVTRG